MTAERSDAAATFDAERPRSLRGFVAIKIAAETADEFAQLTRSLDRSRVQLIDPGDIHLTLVPPWNEVSIPEAGAIIARKHPIDRNLSLAQRVEWVGLMQSPPPGARGYRVLASFPLGRVAEKTPSPGLSTLRICC